ncbi:fungal-specific transcription factor domain-containing protein [Exophiala viscosa]|uniref:Fungal-specific transcription factor domain-containing protein n=1 Tax=Exophiala viscosa TaxID=2486360 RepID=A0AAN6I9R6_9EURO|nr:fungal-specific transcription factor domain-containing protein [Exophiala viscosa]
MAATMAPMSQNGDFESWNGSVDLSTEMIFPSLSLDPELPPTTRRVPKSRRRRQSSTTAGGDGKEASRMLACLSCRGQKIKCSRKGPTCDRCERLQIQCVVPEEDERSRPSSKSHIRELEKQIETLQRRLRETEQRAHRNLYLTPPVMSHLPGGTLDPALADESVQSANPLDSRKTSHPLIAGLCVENAHFQADESGRVRYYGPTSSLHTSEKTSCNFVKWDDSHVDADDHNDISPTLRDHLLERYWRFQHQVLQVVHREAFLQDMQAGRTRYYSKALLYSILANAAVFSEVPEIRALVLSRDEDPEGSKPFLLRKAAEMIEHEIENNVGLTTVQSLQLLSAVYSRRGADTKGWLESGRASRLVFELGLHKDDAEVQSNCSSPMDLEVRRAVFWGSFAYDQGWGLYLGRPCALNLDDVCITPPSFLPDGTSSSSTELPTLPAWATLFTIVGEISKALNKRTFNSHHLQTCCQKLLTWETNLDSRLRHTPGCAPAVYVLQLQYHAAMTLLHRSTARFGMNQAEISPASQASRAICIDHVLSISRLLADYRASHGSAITLLGTAMYNITVAAVVLIAIRAEQASETSNEYLASLTTCITALEEIQFSHGSAKTVLKQLRYLMRRCKLLNTKEDSQAIRDANDSLLPRLPTVGAQTESPPVMLQHLVRQQDWSTDNTLYTDPGQFMLALDDCEALKTMGSWNDFGDVFLS